MLLSDFYQKALRFGKEVDPRKGSGAEITFEDSRILYGRPRTRVSKILVGIDIEVGELLLADRIREKKGLDLVVSHHPEGYAYASLYRVMQLQVDQLAKLGIPRKTAQDMLDERMREVERRIHPANHSRAVDAARLLDLAFVCVHTPADNHVAWFLQDLLRRKEPSTVGKIIDLLLTLPEFAQAACSSCGPQVVLGSPRRKPGRIFVDMTGGTEGPKDVFDKYYKAGVRTVIGMHLSEEHLKKAKDADLNVIIAGHIASDTLGLNLILDKIERSERFQIYECSGFHRVRRG